jgi:signal transduction histidine kinase
MGELDQARWRRDLEEFDDLDLRRSFTPRDQRIATPPERELRAVMGQMGKFTPNDELNCGACGYDTCREHAVAICKGLAESEMCLPNTIDQLRRAVKEVEESSQQLAAAQEALVQSEKMASMGQLAAGIAHEVNNPLGLLLDEAAADSPLRQDLAMVAEQADRCKTIVSGLLHFARQNKVARYPVDLHDLVDRTLRAVQVPGDVAIEVAHEVTDPVAEIDRDQIIQVLTNLITNALAAMGSGGGTLTVRTRGDADQVSISVTDTGVGIPEQNMKKIFEPFFTTKPMGKGTGLGLAVTYGIVKMHSGDIRVQSRADPAAGPTGTTFTVILPRHGP